MSQSSTRTGESTYECTDCLHRERSTTFPGTCNECGGEVRNIAVPRE